MVFRLVESNYHGGKTKKNKRGETLSTGLTNGRFGDFGQRGDKRKQGGVKNNPGEQESCRDTV